MEVKPGYKQTEVGVIPEEWEVKSLGALGHFKNGINKSSEAFGHGSPFVNLMDVFGVSRITSGDAFGLVDTTDAEQKTYDLKRGDVLFIRSSVKPSGVGLTAVVEVDLPKTVYSGFLLRFRDNDALDVGFKRHCFYSEKFRGKLIGASSVSANTNINQDNLKKLFIAVPPTLPEQRAIAEALSDVDGLLAGLDRLIAKKRDLKQAAMQQLLTGQTRLPGFHGEWEETTLGELATFLSGGTPSRSNDDYWTGDIPWISASSLRCFEIWRSDSNVTKEAVAAGSKMAPIGSSLLLVRGSALHNEILCGLVTKPVCFNQDVKALVPRSQVVPRFLTLFIRGTAEEFLKLVSSAGNTAGVLDTKLLKAFAINLPPLAEQTAIATVLSEMDGELAVLEQRREKTRALKQAMMQELLTGRTRLL